MKTIRFMLKVILAFGFFIAAVVAYKFGTYLADKMPVWLGFIVVFIGCLITAAYWTEEEKI